MNYNGIKIGNDFFDELASMAWGEDDFVRYNVCSEMFRLVVILMLKDEEVVRNAFYKAVISVIESQLSLPAFYSLDDATMAMCIKAVERLAKMQQDKEN
jgi:hypothetical protein